MNHELAQPALPKTNHTLYPEFPSTTRMPCLGRPRLTPILPVCKVRHLTVVNRFTVPLAQQVSGTVMTTVHSTFSIH